MIQNGQRRRLKDDTKISRLTASKSQKENIGIKTFKLYKSNVRSKY